MSDRATANSALRVASLAAAIRRRYPDRTSDVSDDALKDFVRDGFEAAVSLEITDDDDVLRFASLPLVLSPAQKASAMIQALAARVLDRKEWDGRKRLDFIYRHLVMRTPSLESESYLRPLFQPGMEDQSQ